MDTETRKDLLLLAQKWRREAEEFNIKYRDSDPHGAQIAVATLEANATELEKLCQNLSSGSVLCS